jgi:propionate CoA-transferase
VCTAEDVQAVRRGVERQVAPLGHKLYGVINYDCFTLDPAAEDDWAAMVRLLVDRHYLEVARYTTSAFLRAKLGPALAARGVVPHIHETLVDARRALAPDQAIAKLTPGCTALAPRRRSH